MKNPITLTAITLLLAASSLPAATHYVSLGSTHPTPPYTNWLTAATNIQDAVEAAQAGDRVVVTDGVYAVGQRETLDNWGRSLGFSRVAVTNTIGLLSVNGPQFTLIDGGGVVPHAGAIRAPHLAQDGAALGADVGDAEGLADFDQLAPRDNDFAAFGQRVQR